MILTHLVLFEFIPGAGTAEVAPPAPTYTANWLSPSIRLGVFLILSLAWDQWPR